MPHLHVAHRLLRSQRRATWIDGKEAAVGARRCRPAASGLPFTFAMVAGVRKNDVALRDLLQTALDRRAREIRSILEAYGVSRLEPGS